MSNDPPMPPPVYTFNWNASATIFVPRQRALTDSDSETTEMQEGTEPAVAPPQPPVQTASQGFTYADAAKKSGNSSGVTTTITQKQAGKNFKPSDFVPLGKNNGKESQTKNSDSKVKQKDVGTNKKDDSDRNGTATTEKDDVDESDIDDKMSTMGL